MKNDDVIRKALELSGHATAELREILVRRSEKNPRQFAYTELERRAARRVLNVRDLGPRVSSSEVQ